VGHRPSLSPALMIRAIGLLNESCRNSCPPLERTRITLFPARHLRAGLFIFRRCAASASFVPPLPPSEEFRNSRLTFSLPFAAGEEIRNSL
jgi:hypothetical protein